jgi:cysteine desulfurase family protein (TIGR01976 family)
MARRDPIPSPVMTALDVSAVRSRFPALSRTEEGRPVAYLDGPGGTQVPAGVIEAMAGRLRVGTSNIGGAFGASLEADAVVEAAREATADLLGGRPGEVAFGQNMTSLTFAVSRALARSWGPGDEVVVTRLDHDANVTPWRLAAADRGAAVRLVDFDPADGTLDLAHLERVLGSRTRLLAVTAASNALGTVPPVRRAADLAHAAGALVYIDAVHYTPHRLVDVAALGADFLACSAYKFFGPHTGVLWGREALLEALEAYKVVPAPDSGPGKWETGTQSFESLAGVAAAVDYLASLGQAAARRERLAAAYAAIREHEEALARRFLAGVAALSQVRLYGLAEPTRLGERTPTFALEVAGLSSEEASRRLGDQGLHTWSGDYYAVGVMEHLGVASRGGLLRIGFVHYNTAAEVDRVLAALAGLRG